MGWVGWPEDKTLAADVNAISIAVEGRANMLSAIFGGSSAAPPRPRRMTADRWRSIVRSNNARFSKRGARARGD